MKPMTAAEFFNVTTCLVLPERRHPADVADGAGRVLAKAGERITAEQQKAIVAAAKEGRLPCWWDSRYRDLLQVHPGGEL